MPAISAPTIVGKSRRRSHWSHARRPLVLGEPVERGEKEMAFQDAKSDEKPSAGRVPPGPPRRATFGILRQLRADRLGLMNGAVREYGDAVRVAIGPKKLYIFNHP
ncbi:MAG: hypothetical protein ACREME_12510, partial [Gemmatimonadales bacterium]